jgi:L-galactose dehydrogenase
MASCDSSLLMDYRTLGKTGVRISALGFGAAPLGDVYGKIDPEECTRAAHEAIEAGINFFDVSPYYGLTLAEERLGKALQGKRDKVILSTKCGRYGVAEFDFSANRVRASIDESLKRLRTDYVDLLFAHDIEFGEADQILNETIPALKDIQRSGKARFIGVTGLPMKILSDLASRADLDAILSYCHYNPMVDDLNEVLVPITKAKGMGLVNASPLHMGILSEDGPPSWHPAPAAVKEKGREVVELCRKRGVSSSQLALRFALDNHSISSTLVGIKNREQLQDNLKALAYKITDELLGEIQKITAPVKKHMWASGRPENSDV